VSTRGPLQALRPTRNCGCHGALNTALVDICHGCRVIPVLHSMCAITSSVVWEGRMRVGKGKGYNRACPAIAMPSQCRSHWRW